ncbi:GNAT family N-acetyltransferase [Glaciimonas sp. Gout2]|uniref:GNAT family N-acetyltransferase n=1 Tax=unclassified Glaciimonas TaxID=2644401 RepID=UPI002B22CAD8|nr:MULTISPECIES: GNAT family N-acetyltransferase [unclassified Glaciimonas]MEB0010997.1 GNAT family N-acetyltransferase [Glaciimonas sp. Cout2]MEB0083272.1 GNAT family N-acetyltransferase [Glaciimonas sp. Gout2]
MNRPTEFRQLDDPATILTAFPIMQELRPHLQDAQLFTAQIERQRTQGYRLLAAYKHNEILGLAGYRLQENLIYGEFIYVDDLVVTARLQRSGVGGELLEAVRQEAIGSGCAHFVLDTGLHMALAQRFYFRHGLLARGMHFVEALMPRGVA